MAGHSRPAIHQVGPLVTQAAATCLTGTPVLRTRPCSDSPTLQVTTATSGGPPSLGDEISECASRRQVRCRVLVARQRKSTGKISWFFLSGGRRLWEPGEYGGVKW